MAEPFNPPICDARLRAMEFVRDFFEAQPTTSVLLKVELERAVEDLIEEIAENWTSNYEDDELDGADVEDFEPEPAVVLPLTPK